MSRFDRDNDKELNTIPRSKHDQSGPIYRGGNSVADGYSTIDMAEPGENRDGIAEPVQSWDGRKFFRP